MADFTPERKSKTDFNKGVKIVDGDGIQSDFFNNVVESQLFTQGLATNAPDVSNANKVGTPAVKLKTATDGSAQLAFENLKGADALTYNKTLIEEVAGDFADEPIYLNNSDFNRTPVVGERFIAFVHCTENDNKYWVYFTINSVEETRCFAQIDTYSQVEFGQKGDTGEKGDTGTSVTDVRVSPTSSSSEGIIYEIVVSLSDGSQITAGDFLIPTSILKGILYFETAEEPIVGETKSTIRRHIITENIGAQFMSIVNGTGSLAGRKWLCLNSITRFWRSDAVPMIDFTIQSAVEITGMVSPLIYTKQLVEEYAGDFSDEEFSLNNADFNRTPQAGDYFNIVYYCQENDDYNYCVFRIERVDAEQCWVRIINESNVGITYALKSQITAELDARTQDLENQIAQAGKVQSVNGKTGDVILTAEDVDLFPIPVSDIKFKF